MNKIKDDLIDEFSISYLLNRLKYFFYFLFSLKNHIFYSTACILFFTISYNYLIPPTYFAQTSFVLDNDNSDGMGELSSIASLAGINPSSFIDASSLFQIDNIQDLYRSDAMLKKTLLSQGVFNKKENLLINRLGEIEKKINKWNLNDINFDNNLNLSRSQDSIIKMEIKKIREKNLIVSKPSRKTTILNISFYHKNEEFAKIFNEKLVSNVNDFYRKSKSFKTGINLSILQKESDSVRLVLNNSIQILAALDEALPNSNPLLKTLRTPFQKAVVDVQANTAIFQELVKQLELAKVSHRNSMPLIQVIDSPTYPLENSKWKLSETLLYGLIFGLFFSVIFNLMLSLLKKF